MADGSSFRTDGKTDTGAGGFIAYYDEEDGLGFQVASSLANPGHGQPTGPGLQQRGAHSYSLTSPRRSAPDTLSALVANDAQKAVLPLQNDRRGYSKDVLAALIDFHGHYDITEMEAPADDAYVLAVPSAMVYELGEAAFPSSYGSGAVGALPRNLQTQTALRRRIGTVYATADAMDRCRAAVDGFRAQGINVVRLADNANPYRDVLSEAYGMLDPDREIETGFDEHTNARTRTSKLKGANYGKALIGVLLPSDVAWLGEGDDYRAEDRNVALRDTDYVIVDQGLVGAKRMETHFLVLNRKAQKAGVDDKKKSGKGDSAVDKIAGEDGAVAPLMRRKGFDTEKNVRVLLKVDTRGNGVADTAELTSLMAQSRLRHTPVILNDRPDTLPTVYEIAIHTDGDRRALHRLLSRAVNPAKGWNPKVLGTYISTRTMPDAPIAQSGFPAWGYIAIGAGAVLVAAIAALALFG